MKTQKEVDNMCNFGGNNCSWIIILILILFCCGGCGNNGCLEAYASGASIAAIYNEITNKNAVEYIKDAILGIEKNRAIILDGYSDEQIELLYKLINYFDEPK